MLVRHGSSPGTCPTLTFQTTTLEGFETIKDEQDQGCVMELRQHVAWGDTANTEEPRTWKMPQGRPLSEADVLELLDGDVDDLLEDEDEVGQGDEQEDGKVLPINLPLADGLNNSYCRVVHTNGIHYLPLVTCGCRGLEKRPADLILNGLIPASFSGSRIYFTTAVLSDYRLANLECKSSALHYWHKLCRHTAAATHPGDMDNFYRELRRLSRGWRWLKKLQWSGVGQAGKGINDVGEGELAIFCPTCPQPEINLPPDWQSDKNW
ncbi:hypothetical protein LshimejAT787_0411430 [Lyophyllum shimeji]|uniref:CxC2-like cysteine cluster KDZ transposase-associated domain-containing protein n=1 Tax=Lyophyllum shimeji TaxID=47721 RepID=A0A9P3PKR4_LYOSH|nr:hypothetical protein LshimejAT787_0411430 [Lyophyllum shimeji]